MDNKELNQALRCEAVRLGLCGQWQQLWKEDWSEEKMIAKYKEGIDFCLKNRFPSNDFIKQNFSAEALKKGGVLVDTAYSALNARCAVIKGSSDVKARYNGDSVGEIYVTDNAKLHVYARNNSHVIVHVLGKADVFARAFDNATLLVIKHSKDCSVMYTGAVRVSEEFGWLD